jgi:hypothetical protein
MCSMGDLTTPQFDFDDPVRIHGSGPVTFRFNDSQKPAHTLTERFKKDSVCALIGA